MKTRNALSLLFLVGAATATLAQQNKTGSVGIEDVLMQHATLEFYKSPLPNVVAKLKETYGTDIRVGGEVKNPEKILVSANLTSISLRSGLNVMLAERDLTWMVDGKALRVTTPGYARQNLKRRSYDLNAIRNKMSRRRLSLIISSLINVKTKSIAFHGAKMSLAATEQKQQLVGGLLECVLANHKVIKEAGNNKQRINDQVLLAPTDILHAGRSQKLRRTLDQESRFDFGTDPPIREAVDYFRQLHKVPLYVDPRAVDSSKRILPINRPVTFREGLDAILKKLKCTWVIEDELLKIVSVKRSLQQPSVQVYVCADLVNDNRPIGAIANSIRRKLKQPNVPKPADRRQIHAFQGMLIIAETGVGQHRVRQLLHEMRDPMDNR